MQILQWLFNTAAAQQPPKLVSNSPPTITKNKCDHCEEDKLKAKGVVILRSNRSHRGERRKRVENSKLNCDDFLLFRFLQRKDVSRPFFYQTLNLKGLGTFFNRRRRNLGKKTTTKTKRSELETTNGGVSALGGNKVLPIVYRSSSSSSDSNINLSDSDNKDKNEAKKKRRGVSRMKELLKWSATTKVLNSKNGAVIKSATVDDEVVCDESPKISFILRSTEDYYNTTTTTTTTTNARGYTISKAYSMLKDDHIQSANTSISTDDDLHAAGIGSWITTDDEFVVLEL